MALGGVTRANVHHLFSLLKQARNPAAVVYESMGSDFFLSPAPGWLNLGLWDGPGDEGEAERAVHRLVETLAAFLPRGAAILDVGNGLGAQDPVIARVAEPRMFVAMNITEAQLRSGRELLTAAGAQPMAGDAVLLPLASDSFDALISVEAAFHFSSRRRFFDEARRVLRPGGKLVMSDVSAERTTARGLKEAVAGLTNLRVWGLRRTNMQSASEIEDLLWDSGFKNVDVERVSDRVFAPAIRFFRQRMASHKGAPWLQRLGAGMLVDHWELLHERAMIEYLLIRAEAR